MGGISSKEWVVEESKVGLAKISMSLFALVAGTSTVISLRRSSHDITYLELGNLGSNLGDHSDYLMSRATWESLISRPFTSGMEMVGSAQTSKCDLSSNISFS